MLVRRSVIKQSNFKLCRNFAGFNKSLLKLLTKQHNVSVIFLWVHVQCRCVRLNVGVWKSFLLSFAFYVKPVSAFILPEEQLQTQIWISQFTEADSSLSSVVTQTLIYRKKVLRKKWCKTGYLKPGGAFSLALKHNFK